MSREEIERRFWALVDKRGPDQCWFWKGGVVTKTGQGMFTLYGTKWSAQRVAYMISHGMIDKNDRVTPTCGHKLCMNPNHLKGPHNL